MRVLLDTNVISELRRGPKADAQVRAWAASLPASEMYLSAIGWLELEWGVLRKERQDRRQGAMLRRWLDGHLKPEFADRTLPIDTAVALACARLHVPDPRAERDALIAATALVHGMPVATRNVADFVPMGVVVLNPWEPRLDDDPA